MRLFHLLWRYSGRHPRLGPVLYVSSIQFFVVQVIVARQWSPPYSLSRDTISDLGNTACGTWSAHFVCSPLHGLMNVSFVVLGMSMALGSALVAQRFAGNRSAMAGLTAMAVSGMGVVVLGAFPENSVPAFHGLGTAVPFVAGNAALIVLAFALRIPVFLRLYSFSSGAAAFLALVSYASGYYAGLGQGGIERVVAYPQVVWLVVAGLYLLVRSPGRRDRRDAGVCQAPGKVNGRPVVADT